MSKWKVCKLGEVAEIVGGGTPKTEVSEYWNGEIAWLTPRDLSNFNGRYISKGERNISKLGLAKSSAKILPKGTVLLSSRAPVGYLAIAKNEVSTNQGFRNLIPNSETDNLFLFYLLKNNVEYLKSQAAGTTFGELAGSTLKSLSFLFPPLPEQRAIAHILGTLDDKIELNRRMNQTLEEMVRALFKNWFVDFEPFRDGGMQDSPLGEIPVGWRVGKLSELCETQYGYTASAINEPAGPHFLRVTDINKQNWIEWDKVPYCEITDEDLAKYRLEIGDLLVARMADPGKSAIVERPVEAVFASYLVRLKTESLAHAYFVYGFLKSQAYADYSEGAMGGSSVQKSMNAKVIVDVDLVVPPQQALEMFLQYVLPLRKRLAANVEQIAILASIRDALLPKLISGEIRVKDAEKFVEKAT